MRYLKKTDVETVETQTESEEKVIEQMKTLLATKDYTIRELKEDISRGEKQYKEL